MGSLILSNPGGVVNSSTPLKPSLFDSMNGPPCVGHSSSRLTFETDSDRVVSVGYTSRGRIWSVRPSSVPSPSHFSSLRNSNLKWSSVRLDPGRGPFGSPTTLSWKSS